MEMIFQVKCPEVRRDLHPGDLVDFSRADKVEIDMRLFSADASRRDLLRSIALAAAGAGFAATAGASFAKGKRSRADVAYQDAPHGVERCEICAPFLPPDQCRTVAGPVSRQGWCKIYQGV